MKHVLCWYKTKRYKTPPTRACVDVFPQPVAMARPPGKLWERKTLSGELSALSNFTTHSPYCDPVTWSQPHTLSQPRSTGRTGKLEVERLGCICCFHTSTRSQMREQAWTRTGYTHVNVHMNTTRAHSWAFDGYVIKGSAWENQVSTELRGYSDLLQYSQN